MIGKKMSEGVKHDQDKLRMDLIPVSGINAVAETLTHGAKKYGDRNWENGLLYSRVYAALLRHLTAWWGGEDIDSESGLSHLSHVATNAFFLVELSNKEGHDDRPMTPERILKMSVDEYRKYKKQIEEEMVRKNNG
jgi:hypothetical protein